MRSYSVVARVECKNRFRPEEEDVQEAQFENIEIMKPVHSRGYMRYQE